MSEENVTGVVIHVLGQHIDGWRAGKLRKPDGETVGFVGACDCEVGERWTLHGTWRTDKKYGLQIAVAWATRELASDWEGIQRVLERDPRFKLIGPIRSKRIEEIVTSEFDGDLGAVLSDPEKRDYLKKKARLPRKALRLLMEEWTQRRVEHETKAAFVNLGLMPRHVDKLWKILGEDGVRVVTENPWIVCDAMDGVSFEAIDQIALKKIGVDRAAPRRLEAGLVEALRTQRDDGHTWTARPRLVSRAMTTLQIGRLGDREATTKRLGELIEKKDERLVLSVLEPVGEVVSDPKYHRSERKITAFFDPATKDEANPHFKNLPFNPAELSWLVKPDHKGVTRAPNEAQTEALLKATQKKKIVITGAAGCGKTTTIAALIRIYQSRNKRVSLAAPTGKAAKRLFEVLDNAGELDRPLSHGPSTIHRLLECRGFGDWGRGPNNRLQTDVVLLDEVSMIEAELMSRVIDALEPNCSLVLVGDPNQLPSVGPGAVLRDLVQGDRCEVARLEKVMRHAGVMRENAKAILSGIMTPTTQEKDENGTPVFEGENPVIPWIVEDRHQDAGSAHRAIAKRFEALLTACGRADVLELQVLSPQYKGLVGINSLNRTLQRVAQRVLYGVEVAPETQGDEDGRPKFRAGDKVVQTKNDYTIDLMNGDQGIVAEIGKDEIILEIERVKGKVSRVAVPKAASEGLMLAWAISIHRFQGCQADDVVVACHSEHSMLNRKLVYTAATRATKSITLIGDHRGLRGSLMKTDTDMRRTFMAPQGLLERFAREAGVQVTT